VPDNYFRSPPFDLRLTTTIDVRRPTEDNLSRRERAGTSSRPLRKTLTGRVCQPVLAISAREIATGRLCARQPRARIPFTISVSYLRGKQIAPRSRVRVTAASYRISLSPRASRTHRDFASRSAVSSATRIDRPSPILPRPPLLTFPLDNFPPPLPHTPPRLLTIVRSIALLLSRFVASLLSASAGGRRSAT